MQDQPNTRARTRALVAVILGNTFEWYDFAIYGILAYYISQAFFPSVEPNAALLATFALFGVSFVMRPVGGLVIGRVGDRWGRRPALLLTIATMAAGTLAIGLVPSHAAIGIAAPVLLLAVRLVQGFSAGGEWGIAASFVSEWAPDGKRGLWGSFLAMTVALGSFFANGLAALLIGMLAPEQMASWGWRVPFLLGGVLGVIGLWLRVGIDETPLYRRARRDRAAPAPPASRTSLRQGLLSFGLTIHWTVCYYFLLLYMPTYTRVQAHLGSAQAVWSNTIGLLAVVCLVPVVGALSDRHGRKPFLVASCLAVIVLTLPALWLIVESRSFAVTVALQLAFGVAIALYSGAAPALMAELFTTRSRSFWTASSYALAVAVFGGFAPFIADWLIAATASPLAPAAYVIAAACASLLAISRVPETAHAPLR